VKKIDVLSANSTKKALGETFEKPVSLNSTMSNIKFMGMQKTPIRNN
jgi:hypothetical protein